MSDSGASGVKFLSQRANNSFAGSTCSLTKSTISGPTTSFGSRLEASRHLMSGRTEWKRYPRRCKQSWGMRQMVLSRLARRVPCFATASSNSFLYIVRNNRAPHFKIQEFVFYVDLFSFILFIISSSLSFLSFFLPPFFFSPKLKSLSVIH